MASIASLMVLVDGNTTPLTAALAKGSASVKTFSTGVSSLASQATGALSQLGAAGAGALVGVVALGGAALAGVSKFEALGASVRTLEKQLGTTAEEASVLAAQGEALGVGVDKMSVGFGILAKHIVANDAMMQKYGITTQQTADGNIDFQALLAELSAKFQELPPGMERTAMAMNLFGRSGKTLLPLLAASSDELATFAKNAEQAGRIMSEDDVQAARALSIAQRELGAAFGGLEVSLARGVVPVLTVLSDALANLVRLLQPVTQHADLLVAAGLGFLGWKFIPGLLETIGLRLLYVRDSLIALKAEGFLVWAAGAASALGGVTVAAGATAYAIGSIPSQPVKDVSDKIEEYLTLAQNAGGVNTQLAQTNIDVAVSLGANRDAFISAISTGGTYADTLNAIHGQAILAGTSASLMDGTIVSMLDTMGHLAPVTDLAAGAIAGLGNEASAAETLIRGLMDAQLALTDSTFAVIDAANGDQTAEHALAAARQHLTNLTDNGIDSGKKYRSAQQDVADAALAAAEAHSHLVGAVFALNNQISDGTTTRKGAISDLKLMGHQAGLTKDEIQDLVDKLRTSADVGLAFGAGFAAGIDQSTWMVEAKAAAMANRAEQAAMDALGAHSPSEVMKDVGADFTIGFAQGIESKMSAVISAIQAVIGEGLSKARLLQAKELEAMASDMASKMERMVAQVQKDWDRLHAQIDDFKSSVRSGFDTIDILGGAQGLGQTLHDDLVSKVQAELDAAKLAQAPAEIIAALEAKLKATTDSTVVPSAADFATFLKDQLATAQQFASALTQLQSMGLNQGLLSELASQGPASLPFLQALISGGKDVISQFNDTQAAIDKIAGKTAGSLADDIFGKRLDKLGLEVENLQDRLAKMAESLADKVSTFIDAIRADAVGVKVDDVIKALDQLAKRLESFQVPGPGNGPGSSSSQSAPYVPGMAAMAAAGVTGTGLGFDFDYDQMAEAQVAAIDRRGGFHPVMVQSEHDAATSRYISKTGAGRRSL